MKPSCGGELPDEFPTFFSGNWSLKLLVSVGVDLGCFFFVFPEKFFFPRKIFFPRKLLISSMLPVFLDCVCVCVYVEGSHVSEAIQSDF